MITVQLELLVNELELISDEGNSYLNTATGQLFHISKEELLYAQGGMSEDVRMPDWQHDNIRVAREILETGHYVQLPTETEINEVGIMEQFSLSLSDTPMGDELHNAITSGNGAQRRFRDVILKHYRGTEWYIFKRKAFRRTAMAWCKKNNIECV